PVGTLSNTTTAAPTVTYTAPSSVAAATQVAVVATSPIDATQSATTTVFINLPVSIESFTFLTNNTNCQYSSSLGNNDGTINATYLPGANVSSVLASGGTGPYTWSVFS